MKSILLSVKPEWVAKILNGEKTIEIRKTMPKCELPIEVYIYCTKEGRPLVLTPLLGWAEEKYCKTIYWWNKEEANKCFESGDLRGNVVAKFTLRKVEEIKYESVNHSLQALYTDSVDRGEFENRSFVPLDDAGEYLGILRIDWLVAKDVFSGGYAWHISDLEIFDEPKELSEFKYVRKFSNCSKCPYESERFPPDDFSHCALGCQDLAVVRRAPQSWMYVEVGK